MRRRTRRRPPDPAQPLQRKLWWPPDRREVEAALYALAFLAAIIFWVMNADKPAKHSSFGPDWDCRHPPYGDPICVKRARAAD